MKLCLNCIVKNEEKTIVRMLDSVIDKIDMFCICDTGSNDKTMQVIMEYFSDKRNIIGKLYSQNFVNFEKNRNESLEMAKSMKPDYILFLDADMELVGDLKKEDLKDDFYHLTQKTSSMETGNVRIIKTSRDFHYRGLTHECIVSGEKDLKEGILNGVWIKDHEDGGSRKEKLERDVTLLSLGLKNPDTERRCLFYLGNTYAAMDKFEDAIRMYKRRIHLGGWDQEMWCSHYKLGLLYHIIGKYDKFREHMLDAYEVLPERVENIYLLMLYYQENKKEKIAEIYRKLGFSILSEKRELRHHIFLDRGMYELEKFTCLPSPSSS